VLVDGSIEAMRGSIRIEDAPYDVAVARASFDGDADPDPAIDVHLTREIEGAQLRIDVTGTARHPELAVSCDPPIYDQTQLLVMVVGGTSAPSDSADKSTDATSEYTNKAVGAVSGLLVSQLKQRFGHYLPIDVLRFDVGLQGSERNAEVRLEVGKYWLSNLYTSLTYQYGSQSARRRTNQYEAHIEYSFLRHFNLAGTFGEAAVGAVDLYWKLRF
jgi:autotransporter translocation and assembly factor TamB